MEFHDLPCKFTPNGTCRPGNDDGFTCQFCPYLPVVQPDLLPFQQILNFDLLDLVETEFSVDPFHHGGHSEDLHLVFEAEVNQFLFALCVELLDGKDHLSDSMDI